jgi:hypothetical protein
VIKTAFDDRGKSQIKLSKVVRFNTVFLLDNSTNPPIGVVMPQKYLIIPPLLEVIPQICDKVSSVGMLSGKVQYNIWLAAIPNSKI